MILKKLLVLGAGRTQLAAIVTAKKMGLNVIAIDPDLDAPGFRFADEKYVFDLANVKDCLEVSRRSNIQGAMTLAADYPVPTLGVICEELGLHGLTRRTAQLSTNKREMRKALREAGVSCPISHCVTTVQEAREALKSLGKDAIFKPTIGQGGRGITRIGRHSNVRVIEAAFTRAVEASRGDGILVEEFVDGPEFSVEALSFGGETYIIAVTDKKTSGPPYYVEIGHSMPSRWPVTDIEALATTAINSVSALGIDWSASHTEIRLSSDGPHVMEVGARLGGGFITTDLVPLSTGIDMVTCAIELALGQEPIYEPKWSRAAAVEFLKAAPGVVERIDGIDRIDPRSCIKSIDVYVTPGDVVSELVDTTCRVGHVICASEDVNDATKRAEKVSKDILVSTLPKKTNLGI